MNPDVSITLPPDLVEAVAERIAEIVLDRLSLAEPPAAGWLDVGGAAEHLSTTPEGVRGLVKRGAIPSHKAGGRRLFDRRELDAFVRGES